MPPPFTVVLNCAGVGRRLGLGQTKALVNVLGRPLIHWQLDLLKEVSDIRVVVGYNAQNVIEAVLARRRNAIFIFNHSYDSTATGDSLVLAARHIDGDVLSLDGDLLIGPREIAVLYRSEQPVLGITPTLSEQAVFVEIESREGEFTAKGFSQVSRSPWEWTGLIRCPASELVRAAIIRGRGPHHVFQLVAPLLPIKAVVVDTREIDTPGDYMRAAAWLAKQTVGGNWM